jgi:hypothetical protein
MLHADLIYRPQSGAADQILAGADSLTMDGPNGIPAGNIVADLAVAALPAACGDLLVVRATNLTGPDVSDFEIDLTLP